MYKMSLIISFLFLSVSCQNEPQKDLHEFITDKIWTDNRRESQYFFSSKNGKEYLWIAAGSNKNALAEGTPETHKYNPSLQGWFLVGDFKIEGDTLITQRKDDMTGENLLKRPIERSKDSTIGIVEYRILTIYPEFFKTKWISRK